MHKNENSGAARYCSEVADAHFRDDANNLVTTTHQPEQTETTLLVQMLRKESNSGLMHDFARVRSEGCLADSLTKHAGKADELINAVLTGNHAHPSFRTMLQSKTCLVECTVRTSLPLQVDNQFVSHTRSAFWHGPRCDQFLPSGQILDEEQTIGHPQWVSPPQPKDLVPHITHITTQYC